MMIFLRPAMCSLRRATGTLDLLLLSGERRGPVTLQQHLHLALRFLQFRCSRPGEPDPLLECRDRLLQREAASLEALHHPSEARDDVLVLLGDGLCGCVGHASPPNIRRAAFLAPRAKSSPEVTPTYKQKFLSRLRSPSSSLRLVRKARLRAAGRAPARPA